MLTCKQVAASISSDWLERSGWRYRLRVRLHLFMCRHCRRYAAQIRALNAAACKLCETTAPDRETLTRLEGSILGSSWARDESAGKTDE